MVVRRVMTGSLALAVVTLLGGCGDNENNPVGPGGMGILAVRLTDAPGEYDAVNIIVDSVRVHVSSADTIGGWYTISRGRAQYNLLEYVNGKDTLIAEDSIPAGVYTQLRLYLGNGSTVVTGGISYPLEVPSGMQSGLKLDIQASIVSGARYELALDFDADRSIVTTGNGRYLLNPVIKVITTALSGSLTGMVIPDTVSTTVQAIAGSDTTTTFTDASGGFAFKYLVPGLYLIRCIPADPAYRIKEVPNTEVTAGQSKDLGPVILQLQ